MKVYRGTEANFEPFYLPAVTVGNFDGVHLGHQALFQKTVQIAQSRRGDAVAVTFEPHPMKVLRPANPPKLISDLEHKCELISRAGISALVVIPFTRDFAARTADEFVKGFLFGKLGMRDLVVGYDYACGKDRQGNIPYLIAVGRELGFRVHVVPPITIDGMVVSSTKVRELVSEGKMRDVARLLGRYYQIRGVVQEGKRRGGPVVGFPTANLHLDEEELVPRSGVYVVQVIHESRCYGGVLNIGRNPTFEDDEMLRAEAHIFDFNRDIYGDPIKINLLERIREERRFPGPGELARQIAKDIEGAKKILSSEADLERACLEA
ncbi:MAG: bifunctional riboflavin kinase/FAD synthetase [Deltaproteobacteria bacterium]